jgi:rSAM/selenodomain-associated transferase 1
MQQPNSQICKPLRRAPKRALILFTSHPGKDALRKHPGQNPECFHDIYRTFLRHALGIAIAAQKQQNFDIIIASETAEHPFTKKTDNDFTDAAPFLFLEQQGNSFEDKFKHTLKTAFQKGYDQVVIIGNDCPDLTAEILVAAFDNLTANDAVLGPAKDGGFYLLGIKNFNTALFDQIPWGSSSVFEKTCRNIIRQELSFCLLPCLQDIDSFKDLTAWLASPFTNQAIWIYRLFVRFVAIRFIFTFHDSPFISKFHIGKRIWQLPPPSSSGNPIYIV